MKNFVEVDFYCDNALCNISITPYEHLQNNCIKIVIGNDDTFTINDESCAINQQQIINPKGFADFLEFCEKLNVLKASLPFESFISKALSNEYVEELVKTISVLADTHYVHIIGLNSMMSFDYINLDIVRNNDSTLNFYIDTVNYVDGEDDKRLAFDIRNGKMCRFFNTYDKVSIKLYHVLNAITSVESSFTDDQMISIIGEGLKKVTGAYDISVRKENVKQSMILPGLHNLKLM